jgi:hypothetical protein
MLDNSKIVAACVPIVETTCCGVAPLGLLHTKPRIRQVLLHRSRVLLVLLLGLIYLALIRLLIGIQGIL